MAPLFPRPFSAAAATVFVLFAFLPAVLADGVCDFPLSRMFVADTSQLQFPVGFLACLDVKNQTIPRCNDCACRELQSRRNGGNVVSWGLCVEGEPSLTCQAANLTLCNADYVWVSATPPGQTTVTNNPKSVAPPVEATPKFSPSLIAVVVGSFAVVALVLGVAFFRARRRTPTHVTPTHADCAASPASKASPCETWFSQYPAPRARGTWCQTRETIDFTCLASFRGTGASSINDDNGWTDNYDIVDDSQRRRMAHAFDTFTVDSNLSQSSSLFLDTTWSQAVDVDTGGRDVYLTNGTSITFYDDDLTQRSLRSP